MRGLQMRPRNQLRGGSLRRSAVGRELRYMGAAAKAGPGRLDMRRAAPSEEEPKPTILEYGGSCLSAEDDVYQASYGKLDCVKLAYARAEKYKLRFLPIDVLAK
ncbi:hypothetical protein NDU88_001832 [Pleurodeles waltl]|uniref:Uncharacterized protein n=1 Tax=Pleurodeles waltl TaxID=8319 RepID=A0AAV7MVQ4_PLEWA|nr:hypothetical protein NDU88_001832 [Pleurodeles waltl]